MLTILYEDEYFIAIDKPAGLMAHRSEFAPREDSAMRILRDQVGQWVYPAHRLDRATSGVMVFARSSEAASALQSLFSERTIRKEYTALVRGWAPQEGVIDYPLSTEADKEAVEAITKFRRLHTVELPIPIGKFPSARYSLIRAQPQTGRMHQIRRHLAHIAYPIIGDVRYGEGRHNRLFREHFGMRRLLLMAVSLTFIHPYSKIELKIDAPYSEDVHALFQTFNWRC